MTRQCVRALFLLVAGLLSAPPAEAYLDPGTASMLVSAVVGVAAAIALALKMFWYRLVGLVRGKRPGTSEGRLRADK